LREEKFRIPACRQAGKSTALFFAPFFWANKRNERVLSPAKEGSTYANKRKEGVLSRAKKIK